jgi:fructose-1,6-bisphosphatase/sedoheptulose 1,7-bisphosphatase-like protein
MSGQESIARLSYVVATPKILRAGVTSVAEAVVAALSMRGCVNRDVARVVIGAALAGALNRHVDGAEIRVRYSTGHKDAIPPVPLGLIVTRPTGDEARLIDLVLDPADAVVNLVQTRRPAGSTVLGLGLVARDTLPDIPTDQLSRTLVMPPGTSPGLGIDSRPDEVIEHLGRDFDGRPVVHVLDRHWNKKQARRYDGAGAEVRQHPAGSLLTHLRAVMPQSAGAEVHISTGMAGMIETILVGIAARLTRSQLLMQPVPNGLEMTPHLAGTPVYDEQRLVPSGDALLVVAAVVGPPGERFLPAVRVARAGGLAYAHVLAVAPEEAGGIQRFVVRVVNGRADEVTRLEPDDKPEDVIVRDYLRTAVIESRLAETDRGDVEYFQNWRGCFVPGLEDASERGLLAILSRLAARGRITKDATVTCGDSSEYYVSGSAESAGVSESGA